MKQVLRTQAKNARAQLSEIERANKSVQIVERLIPLLKGKQTIGIYMPMKYEVDVTSLLFMYASLGVPKIRNQEEMDFFLIHDASELNKGTFNILEPTSNVWISPNDLEVIIVPLVAFDKQKHRVGQGKGYYDRYLAQSNALMIGVAFETQKVESIDVTKHDITLDYIVTENMIYE